jgi:hypothetical protein
MDLWKYCTVGNLGYMDFIVCVCFAQIMDCYLLYAYIQ